MFKALKWAYDMGVRQERVRIAAQLQLRVSSLQNATDFNYDILRNITDKPVQKTAKEKIKFNIAVHNQVKSIINEIFTPKGEWINDESIMFPNDKEK